MIKKISHKGLKRLYEDDDGRGISAEMRDRLEEILTLLDAAETSADMDIPGYRLHQLKGDRKGYWSIRVTGNWRVTFHLEEGHVWDVDLEDYH